MPSAPVCIMKNEAGSEYLFKKCSRKPLLQGDLSHHGVKEKYQPLYQKLVLNMVEVGGIEPPSESLLTSFSPSAATILGFPSPVASRRAAGYGSFMITGNASKLWRARSPHS